VDRRPLLLEWDRRPLLPSPEVLAAAQGIGATPPDVYGNGTDQVQVPCEVLTTHGERFEMALLSFQAHPPLEDAYFTVRLIDEVAVVAPSEFALPRPVRLATTRAVEVSMGFAPTVVHSPDGRAFALNWTTNFFATEGSRGRDLALAAVTPEQRPPVISEDSRAVACFVGDRFPDVERLWLADRGPGAT
jgi:hypothetical protein